MTDLEADPPTYSSRQTCPDLITCMNPGDSMLPRKEVRSRFYRVQAAIRNGLGRHGIDSPNR